MKPIKPKKTNKKVGEFNQNSLISTTTKKPINQNLHYLTKKKKREREKREHASDLSLDVAALLAEASLPTSQLLLWVSFGL